MFLYPKSNQYCFDVSSRELVLALQSHCDPFWSNVPDTYLSSRSSFVSLPITVKGLNVSFDSYGGVYKKVHEIWNDQFSVRFYRSQGLVEGSNQWNDCAAISSIHVPGMKLEVYSDYSGPTLEVYVGKDYEKDLHWWNKHIHVNSRLHNEPRRYLKYHGTWGAMDNPPRTYWYSGRLAPFMTHNVDLGREYSPQPGKPHPALWSLIPDQFDNTIGLEENDCPRYMDMNKVMEYFHTAVRKLLEIARG